MYRRCMKCMKTFRIPRASEKENCICPHCGFAEGMPPSNLNLLFPGVMLHDRYEIGADSYSAGIGNWYLSWDHQEKRMVRILELFPCGMAIRLPGTTEVTVPDEKKNSFNAFSERFNMESNEFLNLERCDSIVQVTDLFHENNTYYRVKECYECVPFSTVLRERKALAYEQAAEIVCSVCEALTVLHRNGILHCDIDPHNIYITQNPGKVVVEVVDCGTAFHYVRRDAASERLVVFSPGYAPPEQYACRTNDLGPWVDTYAVAALFFQMLTGVRPDESSDRMMGKDSVEEELNRVQTIPQDMKNVILMGMELDYKKRFQTAESFRDAVLGKIKIEKKRNVLGRLSWKCHTI